MDGLGRPDEQANEGASLRGKAGPASAGLGSCCRGLRFACPCPTRRPSESALTARLLLGLALLWAVFVPALHGHAAGLAAHAHAPGLVAGLGLDDSATAGQPASHADASQAADRAAHAAGVHDVAAHDDAEFAHAEGDLPLATELALLVVASVLALAWLVPAPRAVGIRVAPCDEPRVRGSPVDRHEVARI